MLSENQSSHRPAQGRSAIWPAFADIGRKAIDTPDNQKNIGHGSLWETHQRERPRVSIKLKPNNAAKMTSALPRPRVIRLRVAFAATRSVDTAGEPYSSRTRAHAISTQTKRGEQGDQNPDKFRC